MVGVLAVSGVWYVRMCGMNKLQLNLCDLFPNAEGQSGLC